MIVEVLEDFYKIEIKMYFVSSTTVTDEIEKSYKSTLINIKENKII